MNLFVATVLAFAFFLSGTSLAGYNCIGFDALAHPGGDVENIDPDGLLFSKILDYNDTDVDYINIDLSDGLSVALAKLNDEFRIVYLEEDFKTLVQSASSVYGTNHLQTLGTLGPYYLVVDCEWF